MPIPSERFTKLFQVPYQGIQQRMPIHALPDDAVYNALNMIVRDGEWRTRPTITPTLNADDPDEGQYDVIPAGAMNLGGTSGGLMMGGGKVYKVSDDGAVEDITGGVQPSNAGFDSWSGGTSSAPDDWSVAAPLGYAIARDSSAPTTLYGPYSARVTRSPIGDTYLVQNLVSTAFPVTWWQGKSITVSAWVRASVINTGAIGLNDGVATAGSLGHPGDGVWRQLSFTATISASATQVQIYGLVGGPGTPVVYFDQFEVTMAMASSGWGRMTTIVLGSGTTEDLYVLGFGGPISGTPSPTGIYNFQWRAQPPVVPPYELTQPIAGDPPPFTDACTIADKIVGVVPPYLVQWSPTRIIDKWPALNYKQLAETPDPIVAIRPVGVTGGVIFKKQSIWTVNPTGSVSDASAFRFDYAGAYEGPATPNAIVEANGVLYYMTPSGRIGAFSGQQHQWVCDGAWPRIVLDPDHREEWTFATFDPIHDDVQFFYPGGSGATGARSIALVTLPRETGPTTYTCTIGYVPGDFYAGVAMQQFDDLDDYGQALTVTLFGAPDYVDTYTGGRVYKYGAPEPDLDDAFFASTSRNDVLVDDSMAEVEWALIAEWQTGLTPSPNGDMIRYDAVETMASRGDGYGQIFVAPVTANVLGTQEGTEGTMVPVSLGQQRDPPSADVAIEAQGRFVGLHYYVNPNSFTATDPAELDTTTPCLRWKGAVLKAQKARL